MLAGGSAVSGFGTCTPARRRIEGLGACARPGSRNAFAFLTNKATGEEACEFWNRFKFCFEKIQSGLSLKFSERGS
jgi:hypothetical protein